MRNDVVVNGRRKNRVQCLVATSVGYTTSCSHQVPSFASETSLHDESRKAASHRVRCCGQASNAAPRAAEPTPNSRL